MGDRFRGRRQEKDWVALPSVSVDFTGDNSTGVVELAFSSSITVLRMLGEYVIAPTSAGGIVAGDDARIAIGIGLVSTDAFAATTALPDPAGEPEYPWLYWAQHSFLYPVAGATAADSVGLAGAVRKSFDIRSMRKFKAGQSLALVAQYVNVTGDPALTFGLSRTRVLIGGL